MADSGLLRDGGGGGDGSGACLYRGSGGGGGACRYGRSGAGGGACLYGGGGDGGQRAGRRHDADELKVRGGEQRGPLGPGALAAADRDEHVEVEEVGKIDVPRLGPGPRAADHLHQHHPGARPGHGGADAAQDGGGGGVVPVVEDVLEHVHVGAVGHRAGVEEAARRDGAAVAHAGAAEDRVGAGDDGGLVEEGAP